MTNKSKIKKVETVLDRGTSEYLEDGFFFREEENSTILTVCDAFSKPYNKKDTPITLFDGMSSGEMIKNIFFNRLEISEPLNRLFNIVMDADRMIGDFNKQAGFPFKSDSMAGLVFAIIRINDSVIEIFQGGDCIAVWKNRDGSIGFTPNNVLKATIYVKEVFKNLMRECKGDREEARRRFTPLLMQEKTRNTNTHHKESYPVLNGQVNSNLFHHELLNINEVEMLTLFSDGFIPFQWFDNNRKMGNLINSIQKNGINYHLKKYRKEQSQGKTTQDIAPFPESTAIAVWFK